MYLPEAFHNGPLEKERKYFNGRLYINLQDLNLITSNIYTSTGQLVGHYDTRNILVELLGTLRYDSMRCDAITADSMTSKYI